jgi:hypothetical protein
MLSATLEELDLCNAAPAGRETEMISYLVDLLLLRREVPFPDDGSSEEISAVRNWGVVGRARLGQHPGAAHTPDKHGSDKAGTPDLFER